MSVLTLFSGIFCNEAAVVRDLVESTGLVLITDEKIIETASELSGMEKSKLAKAFSARTSVFNNFTHEKERSIAYLRQSLAKILENENCIVSGYSGLLIPSNIRHVLRVCLIAKTEFRLALAKEEGQLSDKQATQAILYEDRDRSAWTDALFFEPDPWNPTLYDMVLPMGKTQPAKASALIEENLLKMALQRTKDSKAAVDDFLLAADTEVALANAGHNVRVRAQNGRIVLTITRQVLMLSRLEEELKAIAQKVAGVVSVETLVNQEDPHSPIYKRHNFELPSKVLLVDDEREFVQTLSERLQMRDMGSVVAYDGKSALDLVQNDEPEVMIIDLKMPEIDGMEILRQVKQIRPGIQVIVLTGHGSEQDRKTCMNMGAFAYMQKPVDINLLSETLKKAHKGFVAQGKTPV
ncbi:MAG: response regulator [Proteobacteria bacterium]|nr:response regulator [Desulfobacula sp.]MBU3954641.1 response regulator [Pseudomonadota bacterium]MBU4131491.1 response regulator [Pseudomonadota bacterium]